MSLAAQCMIVASFDMPFCACVVYHCPEGALLSFPPCCSASVDLALLNAWKSASVTASGDKVASSPLLYMVAGLDGERALLILSWQHLVTGKPCLSYFT